MSAELEDLKGKSEGCEPILALRMCSLTCRFLQGAREQAEQAEAELGKAQTAAAEAAAAAAAAQEKKATARSLTALVCHDNLSPPWVFLEAAEIRLQAGTLHSYRKAAATYKCNTSGRGSRQESRYPAEGAGSLRGQFCRCRSFWAVRDWPGRLNRRHSRLALRLRRPLPASLHGCKRCL